MDSKDWSERLTAQIGQGIEQCRGKRSDQWIADKTAEMGHPLSRSAISEYRRGIRKTMPVADWLVIAAALGVPPVALLFPNLPDGEVELLPDRKEVVAFDALQWVTGERSTMPKGTEPLFEIDTGKFLGFFVLHAEYMELGDEDSPTRPPTRVIKHSRALSEVAQFHFTERARVYKSTRHWSEDEAARELKRLKHLEAQITELREKIERDGGVIKDHGTPYHLDDDGEG